MILGDHHVFMWFPFTFYSEKIISTVLPFCCSQCDVGCNWMAVVRVLTPCRIVGWHRPFEGTFCLRLQGDVIKFKNFPP